MTSLVLLNKFDPEVDIGPGLNELPYGLISLKITVPVAKEFSGSGFFYKTEGPATSFLTGTSVSF